MAAGRAVGRPAVTAAFSASGVIVGRSAEQNGLPLNSPLMGWRDEASTKRDDTVP